MAVWEKQNKPLVARRKITHIGRRSTRAHERENRCDPLSDPEIALFFGL